MIKDEAKRERDVSVLFGEDTALGSPAQSDVSKCRRDRGFRRVSQKKSRKGQSHMRGWALD